MVCSKADGRLSTKKTECRRSKIKPIIMCCRGVTIHVPFDSIRFRLLPFGFDYFDSIMQNINDF